MEFSSLEKISNIFFLRGVLKMVTRVTAFPDLSEWAREELGWA